MIERLALISIVWIIGVCCMWLVNLISVRCNHKHALWAVLSHMLIVSCTTMSTAIIIVNAWG